MRLAGWMQLRTPTFLHFRVAAARLQAYLGDDLALDRFGGSAWLTLVGQEAVGPTTHREPGWAGRNLLSYHQVNLRTYVVGEHGPGILLLETWVDRRLATLPRLAGMPYRRVSPLSVAQQDGEVRVESPSLRWVAAIREPEASEAEEGTLAHFLLERYLLYAGPSALRYALRVIHDPWRVQALETVALETTHPLLAGAGPAVAAHLGQHQEVRFVEAVLGHRRAAMALTEPAPTP